jgi:GTP:adenosylcobinamide-phosphate guanylyltransferase
MGALNNISKKVWGSRISDCYVEDLKERIESNQKDLFESVMADHSDKDNNFVDDVLEGIEEAYTPDEAPTQTCVSIGDFRIVVPKGSEIVISKVELGDFRVEGGGSVKIGRVTKSNFEDIVIQG